MPAIKPKKMLQSGYTSSSRLDPRKRKRGSGWNLDWAQCLNRRLTGCCSLETEPERHWRWCCEHQNLQRKKGNITRIVRYAVFFLRKRFWTQSHTETHCVFSALFAVCWSDWAELSWRCSWSSWAWKLSLDWALLWRPQPLRREFQNWMSLPGQVIARSIGDVIQTHVVPVLLGSHRKLFPPFHQEDAGVADFSRSRFAQSAKHLQFVKNVQRLTKKIPCVHMWLLPKTAPEVLLIALAVSETGAGGLGPTDAAAVQAPVHFWLVKAKHLHGK